MMDVGQVVERGENIILLRTNISVPPHVIKELLDLENVHVAQVLKI
jgi:D-3-phosphoglycerate dehydrogenase